MLRARGVVLGALTAFLLSIGAGQAQSPEQQKPQEKPQAETQAAEKQTETAQKKDEVPPLPIRASAAVAQATAAQVGPLQRFWRRNFVTAGERQASEATNEPEAAQAREANQASEALQDVFRPEN